MTAYSFSKTQRLLNASMYKAVFDDAQIKVSSQEILLLSKPNGLDHSRLGLVIAKKNVRKAVQRNRIKRIIRNSFRLQEHQQSGIDTVVLARRGLDRMDSTTMRQMIEQLWQQLHNKAERKLKKQPFVN